MLSEEVSSELIVYLNISILTPFAIFFRAQVNNARDVGNFKGLSFFDFDSIDDPKSTSFILPRHN